MKKVYIVGHFPFIEKEVVSKDGSLKATVGFKKYAFEAFRDKLASFDNKTEEEIKTLLRGEVLYLKGVSIETYDDEDDMFTPLDKVVIADTRQAKTLEGVWEDKVQCLNVLLDKYLSDATWALSLFNQFMATGTDSMDIEEAQAKNS
jgi:hypothetical protein